MITIEEYFVYITSNKYNRVLCVGMTNNLVRRIYEHKTGKFENNFTKKHKVNKLVYFEKLENKHKAGKREKQIKSFLR